MATISIGFQIQNKGNGFQELIVDADKFKNLLTQTVMESKKLENKMVSFRDSRKTSRLPMTPRWRPNASWSR